MQLKVQVLEDGYLPTKKHKNDAGWDLYAAHDAVVYGGETVQLALNIKVELPEGHYGEITTKSSLGARGLLVFAGVIDQDYRGVLHVVMHNLNQPGYETAHYISQGDKIAQLIVKPCANGDKILLTEVVVRNNTARGEGGFGSTGARYE